MAQKKNWPLHTTTRNPAMPAALPQAPGPTWALGDKDVRTFILRFAAIALALALVPLVPGWDALVGGYMAALAVLVNALLHLLGQPTQLAGANVFSTAYNVTLAPHCAALDIVLFYSATVLAFPTSTARKVAGLVVGFIAIAALNLVRISTVYLIGARWPSRVQGAHEGLWPVLLIMATVVLCATWICWAERRRAA